MPLVYSRGVLIGEKLNRIGFFVILKHFFCSVHPAYIFLKGVIQEIMRFLSRLKKHIVSWGILCLCEFVYTLVTFQKYEVYAGRNDLLNKMLQKVLF